MYKKIKGALNPAEGVRLWEEFKLEGKRSGVCCDKPLTHTHTVEMLRGM